MSMDGRYLENVSEVKYLIYGLDELDTERNKSTIRLSMNVRT